MSETTPLIKAALNLRVGAGFDVYINRVFIAEVFTYFVTWTKTSPFSPCVLHKIMQKEPKWVHGHGENGWNRK